MIRTQVSFDEAAYRAAQKEARRRGISFAEFCRRAIGRALAERRLEPALAREERPWMRFAGSLQSQDPDASGSVDDVVYNRRRP